MRGYVRAVSTAAALTVALLCLVPCLAGSGSIEATRRQPDKQLQFLAVSLPLSPLHSIVAIGQELCLRGHNVTVASVGEEGAKKTSKYAPICKLNYLSLGPSPLSKSEISRKIADSIMTTNSTFKQLKTALGLFSAFQSAMEGPMDEALRRGLVKPDFALISLPVGGMARILEKHGVDFAVNVPTSLLPPLSDQLAQWVPPAFYPASVHGMSLWDRLIVLGANGAIRLVKRVSSALGIVPPAMSDLDPGTLKGRLTLVNSIPGLDYPQPLPPLIQYTGPVVEIDKLESFPPEVEAWLETVPDGKPVVYVSYGTAAVLSPGQVQHMLTSLSGEDFYVLWALPKAQQAGVPADLPRNMMIHHWIPTPRALAHPKVKAFVSHCGGNSVSESMAMGKPIIGYPQFGDQPANCQRVADAGAGITAAKTQSWVKREHVLEVLSNPSYEKRAQVLQRLFKAFGGAQKAADLLEIGASGDFALMIPATEHSFWSWFTLNGYDISLVLFVASSLIMCRAVSCLFGRGRVTADKLKMN